jgi:hypothetical protein
VLRHRHKYLRFRHHNQTGTRTSTSTCAVLMTVLRSLARRRHHIRYALSYARRSYFRSDPRRSSARVRRSGYQPHRDILVRHVTVQPISAHPSVIMSHSNIRQYSTGSKILHHVVVLPTPPRYCIRHIACRLINRRVRPDKRYTGSHVLHT